MNLARLATRGPGAGTVDAIVIGAGQSGLAMSYSLRRCGIDHVVLERGEPGNAWRRERWDSLRLLTPNWQNALPGCRYESDDPDGFLDASAVGDWIATYSRRIDAPVRTGTAVTAVRRAADGYRVVTDRGVWHGRALVLASGAHAVASVPACSAAVPPSVASYTPFEYRNPAQCDQRGVLVVGASATGLQLAAELQRSGRAVTLAVGEHVRMPRLYRGRDILWWMNATGMLDERYDELTEIERLRRLPSPQLVGTPERATLDLNALSGMGVRIVGRLADIRDGRALFSGSLRNHCAMADLKLCRLLEAVDRWAERNGLSREVDPPVRPEPTRIAASPCLGLDLQSGEIGSIVWATGFRPNFSWLDVPVFDRKGRIRHEGGVVDHPGLYVMGLHFMRRRKSSFICGAGDDARELSAHLRAYLDGHARRKSLRASAATAQGRGVQDFSDIALCTNLWGANSQFY